MTSIPLSDEQADRIEAGERLWEVRSMTHDHQCCMDSESPTNFPEWFTEADQRVYTRCQDLIRSVREGYYDEGPEPQTDWGMDLCGLVDLLIEAGVGIMWTGHTENLRT